MGVVATEYPIRSGNRFTLTMHDGNNARVQNMSAEDFTEICKRKKLYSVEVLYIPDERICYVIDGVIPRDWFTVCEMGNYTYAFDLADGNDCTMTYKGKVKWDEGIINAPYVLECFTAEEITKDDYTTELDVDSDWNDG